MLSKALDRISFWSLFLVVVLMPVFVLPFTNIPIETSKGLLLVIGLTVAVMFWIMARFFDGEMSIPKSYLLGAGLILVAVFLLSALLSPTPEVSLFGAMLDSASFWFIFTAFLLMLFSSLIVINEPANAKTIFFGLIVSSSLLLVFQLLHLFFPQFLSLGGILPGKADNLFGSWNSLGILAGFSSIISLFLIEFFSMGGSTKWYLRALVIFSTLMVAVVNFSLVWALLGISALLIFVYKISFYSKSEEEERGKAEFPVFSLVVMMASLLFFLSGQFVGDFIPTKLGINNIDVSPKLKTTLGITKSVVMEDPILGSGPNKFADAWAKHKPVSVNNSPFWDTSFGAGSGLIPTWAATTGVLGILAILLFFGLFITSGVKSLLATLHNGTNQEITAFFVASLYLFVASFFYTTGPAVILLAFALAGVFIGLLSSVRGDKRITLSFLKDRRKGFFSIMLLVLVMIGTAALAFRYIERFASVTHFRNALAAPTIPEAATEIGKALTLNSNDLYLRTYSVIHLLKFNSLLNESKNPSEEAKAELQGVFDNAIRSASMAVVYNRENYNNYRTLGLIYASIAPFSNADSYKNALEAYKVAATLNPTNPGIQLDLARVSLATRNFTEANNYANQAITLKPNYIDGHLILSQISLAENKRTAAISHAEKALSFAPTNKDLIQYVNSLKNNSPTPPPTVESSEEAE